MRQRGQSLLQHTGWRSSTLQQIQLYPVIVLLILTTLVMSLHSANSSSPIPTSRVVDSKWFIRSSLGSAHLPAAKREWESIGVFFLSKDRRRSMLASEAASEAANCSSCFALIPGNWEYDIFSGTLFDERGEVLATFDWSSGPKYCPHIIQTSVAANPIWLIPRDGSLLEVGC